MARKLRRERAPRQRRFEVAGLVGQFWRSSSQLVVGRLVRIRGVLSGDIRLFVGQGCKGAGGLCLTHGQLIELRALVDKLIVATGDKAAETFEKGD